MNYLIFLLIFTIAQVGCVGGGPQLSVSREAGGDGSPAGNPVVPLFPPVTTNTAVVSGGTTVWASENFRGSSSSSFLSSSSMKGDLYRHLGSDVVMGGGRLEKKAE